jgi:hypothetical protein
VPFDDGIVLEYAVNVIAENFYSQINQEGHRYVILDSIVDHKKGASAESTKFIEVIGKLCRSMTTKGWKLCLQWKDKTTG